MKLSFGKICYFLLLLLVSLTQARRCSFKRKGVTTVGICTEKQYCRRARAASPSKCKGKRDTCCNITLPSCASGGWCAVKTKCKPKNRMGKCGKNFPNYVVCCKGAPKTLTLCGKGGFCNFRVGCKKKDIIGNCPADPKNNALVCCKESPPELGKWMTDPYSRDHSLVVWFS